MGCTHSKSEQNENSDNRQGNTSGTDVQKNNQTGGGGGVRKVDGPNDPKVAKILLLGAGESGKSTFAKQLRLLHGNGFSEGEVLQYQLLIMSNAIEGISMMLRLAETSNLPLAKEKNVALKDVVYNADLNFQASAFDEKSDAEASAAQAILEKIRPVIENLMEDDTLKVLAQGRNYKKIFKKNVRKDYKNNINFLLFFLKFFFL